ncbi:MAG: hypothetical protein V3W44_10150 [Dehalococcoidales bacterium]
MATYTSLRATAQRLIQKNGRDITYRRQSTTLLDVNNPQRGTDTSVIEVTVKASFVNQTFSDRGRDLVQAGDLVCLIAADDLPGFIPDTSNVIIDAGIEYKVVDFQPIDPSDAPVAYQFVLRV